MTDSKPPQTFEEFKRIIESFPRERCCPHCQSAYNEGVTAGVASQQAEIERWREGCLFNDKMLAQKVADYESLKARYEAVIEVAKLKRNVLINGESDYKPKFEGKWVAIPREDFDNLRAALAALPFISPYDQGGIDDQEVNAGDQ